MEGRRHEVTGDGWREWRQRCHSRLPTFGDYLQLGSRHQIFFSIDATPIGALQDDPSEVFLDPLALGEPELERAIRQMLATDEGVVNYRFLGKRRTVLYRKSQVTGWWYAFGHVWD